MAQARRLLIGIPIIHTQADLGSVREAVIAVYARKIGRRKWTRHVQAIDEMWRKIGVRIRMLNLDCTKVRLYQDGLPECGREIEIVKDLARAGSQNHQLLLDLVEKGAQLTGTESPELLLEEYELARQSLDSLKDDGTTGAAERREERSRSILEKRDRHIAQRIDGTLRMGDTGLIFLGMLHSLGRFLPEDIRFKDVGQATRHGLKTGGSGLH